MKDFKDIILLSFLRCLEREGCAGIYWSFRRPRKICSTYIIDKVKTNQIWRFYLTFSISGLWNTGGQWWIWPAQIIVSLKTSSTKTMYIKVINFLYKIISWGQTNCHTKYLSWKLLEWGQHLYCDQHSKL